MLDFITGWILGKNSNKDKVVKTQEFTDDRLIEEIIEIPKVIKYVPIPEITDFDATLESSYKDYEELGLVAIYKNGHIYYYKEVEVFETQIYYGKQKMLDFI